MTDLSKICPLTGENCNCLKGQCAEADSIAAHTQEAEFERDNAEQQYANADDQEARSLKYADAPKIQQLSSGKFALFGRWSKDNGTPLIAIASWSELETLVIEYCKAADTKWGNEQEWLATKTASKPAIDYDNLFGDE